MTTRTHKKGFTLVELSITLVIIGLLIAAITSGSHLIQAAKINKVISELSGHATAAYDFKDKYGFWPGDMPNATSFWEGTVTTNGDGNEQINNDTKEENLLAWYHLSKADFIPGDYTGTPGSGFKPKINVPPSAISDEAFYYIKTVTIDGRYEEVIQLSSDGAGDPDGSALTPEDARAIDKKIDPGDGLVANIGTLRSERGSDQTGTTCIDAGNYLLTDYTISCRLIYLINP